MSDTAYDDIDREARADYLANRPAPDRPSPSELVEREDAWPFRQVAQGPDPWAREQIQCERCDEYRNPYCSHGKELCSECASFCCEICETEQADYAALIEQRREEHYR